MTSDAAAAVEVDRLGFRYGERVALEDVAFQVRPGEIFGLLGPNGGGKSTCLRILATLLRPSAGAARIFGHSVADSPGEVRRRIAVVFQSPSVDRKLTVAENLRHQGRLYGLRGAELARRADEMLARFGLADRARELVEKLSGGLRRRVELAKSLLHRPDLLLLDEPTTGLDPTARRELWDAVRELRKSDGTTALLTTHLLEEAETCDRLAIVSRGKLVALGTPDELKAQVGGDVVTVVSRDAAALQGDVETRFRVKPSVVDGALRIEREGGRALVPQLLEAFPGRIESVTVGRPSLEDVFVRRTGRRFEDDER